MFLDSLLHNSINKTRVIHKLNKIVICGHITIYEVMGEDGKIYQGLYRRSLVCNSFFYTEDDYIEYLNNYLKKNNEKVNEINRITKEIEENITLIKNENKKLIKK